jgi:hypothetical protein
LEEGEVVVVLKSEDDYLSIVYPTGVHERQCMKFTDAATHEHATQWSNSPVQRWRDLAVLPPQLPTTVSLQQVSLRFHTLPDYLDQLAVSASSLERPIEEVDRPTTW